MDNSPKTDVNYENFQNNSELDISDTNYNLENCPNTDREINQAVDIKNGNNRQLSDYCATWSFVPLNDITVSNIFALIEDCILANSFEIIERQPYEAIAIRNAGKGLIDVVKLCVPCMNKNAKHTSFKFVIHESQDGKVSKVEFKCLVGSTKTVNDLFEFFKKQIEKKQGISGKSDFVKNKKSEYLKGSKDNQKSTAYQQIGNIELNDDKSETIEMESNKIVHINKL